MARRRRQASLREVSLRIVDALEGIPVARALSALGMVTGTLMRSSVTGPARRDVHDSWSAELREQVLFDAPGRESRELH
jgi:hypothetical protein